MCCFETKKTRKILKYALVDDFKNENLDKFYVWKWLLLTRDFSSLSSFSY